LLWLGDVSGRKRVVHAKTRSLEGKKRMVRAEARRTRRGCGWGWCQLSVASGEDQGRIGI